MLVGIVPLSFDKLKRVTDIITFERTITFKVLLSDCSSKADRENQVLDMSATNGPDHDNSQSTPTDSKSIRRECIDVVVLVCVDVNSSAQEQRAVGSMCVGETELGAAQRILGELGKIIFQPFAVF